MELVCSISNILYIMRAGSKARWTQLWNVSQAIECIHYFTSWSSFRSPMHPPRNLNVGCVIHIEDKRWLQCPLKQCKCFWQYISKLAEHISLEDLVSSSVHPGLLHTFWCSIVRSFQRANPAILKKIICVVSVQWFKGSKLWPNNTVNTKFCHKIFLGLIKANPPKNALYHTVQMVLVGHCEQLFFRFW